MRTPRYACALLALVALVAAAQMQFQMGPPLDETGNKILAEIKEHSELMQNLEYLSDVIGPRLTGTARGKRANEWTMERFKQYGLDNPHLEGWTIANAWERVSARGRVIEPAQHALTLAAAGWSPGTNGVIRGPIVQVKSQRLEDLQAYKGKLKGAIVITADGRRGMQFPTPPGTPAAPAAPAAPETPPAPAAQAPAAPRAQPAAPVDARDMMENFMRMARQRDEFFKSEGVAAILRNSGKEHGLLNMGGAGRNYEISAIPSAFITSENFALIERLLAHGPVEAELEIANNVTRGPLEVYNTVAEIRGSENPDEVVLLGAHIDSWDLGTGTTDDGTGTAVVLEVARALKAVNLKPKRTIRFVLFNGEEQGLVGSREYVKAHKAELDKFSAILVHDTGTGKVTSIGMSGQYAAREIMDRVVAPMRLLGLQELSMRSMGGTDHASFNPEGVPGFYCIQDMADYNKTHHSQTDTFDKAKKDDLIQGAQVMAVWAYRVAQLPNLLPRQPKPATSAPSGN